MWKRNVGGQVLRFRLAGINNQNFLMRDDATGSWWQQITGKAIFGPMKGRQLDPVLSDELTFATWRQEAPMGQVLAPVAKDAKEYESDWERHVAKLPVVISFPGPLQSRDVIVGMEIAGMSRAYPLPAILSELVVQDRLGEIPILLVVGPDGTSVRAFISRIAGKDIEMLRTTEAAKWGLVDSESASVWNFQGCATSGAMSGQCLGELPALKDYWFDWRNYHPASTVYHR